MNRTMFVAGALLLLSLFATVPRAGAEGLSPETKKAARQYFTQATQLFNARRYDEAVVGYEAAYRLSGFAEMLYNIGQCYRLKGDAPRAVDYYNRYLAADPNGKFAATAREHLQSMTPAAPPKPVESPPPPPPAPVPPPAAVAPVAPEPVVARPVEAPESPAPKPVWKRWWPWTVAGVAAAGLGVGLGVGLTRPTGAPGCPECTDGVLRF